MDKRLLDLLCCPISKTPLHQANKAELDTLNRAMDEGQLYTTSGIRIQMRLSAALITADGQMAYRIDDGIPVLLPEEAIKLK